MASFIAPDFYRTRLCYQQFNFNFNTGTIKPSQYYWLVLLVTDMNISVTLTFSIRLYVTVDNLMLQYAQCN